MIFYNNFNIKILFFFSLLLILKLPLNNINDLTFVIIALFFITFFEIKKKFSHKYVFLLLIPIIIITSNLLNKDRINEAHSIFFSYKDIGIISKFLPKKIIEDIKVDHKIIFDFERALKSHDLNAFSSIENFNNYQFIENPVAFSSDNFFNKSKLTRKVNSINFRSRENLKIGQLNTINFNLAFDKEFRRSLPYYVFYEIPKSYKNSNICIKGNVYYLFKNNKISDFQNEIYTKIKSNCIQYDKSFDYLYLIGYSINKKDNLEIILEKNISLNLVFITLLLLKFLFLYIFFKIFFTLKKNTKFDYIVFFISIIFSITFILLKDPNLLTGLRYFRGGADGLFQEHQGYKIIENISKNNFSEAIRGGADIFYFMPGLRYFIALNKIFFGETSYGYILIGIFLPIYTHKLIKNLISEKVAFYLIISFLIFPIFENMGFGHFNYIHQIVRNHSETLSIFLIVFFLSKITTKDFIYDINYFSFFLYSFLLAFSVLCRPNFLPTTTLFFLYSIILIYRRKNINLILSGIIGYSFVLLSLFHNVYFGNEIIIFTKSNVHFVFTDVFQRLNLDSAEKNIIIHQLLKWNPIYNLHRLLILIFIIYSFFRFEKNLFNIFLLFSVLSQHIVLLVTHPDSRYAYLAWFLTFLIFIYYLFNNYLKKLK